jgi:hypothetical protein
MKVSRDPKVLVQSGLRISPNAEKAYLALDLLAPLAVVVGSQRK